MNDSITQDMDALYKKTGQSRNVSPAVEKHFPPEMSLEDALKLLEKQGFDVQLITKKEAPEGQKWYSAEKIYKREKVILGWRANVIVESDGAKVLKSRGYIFFDGI